MSLCGFHRIIQYWVEFAAESNKIQQILVREILEEECYMLRSIKDTNVKITRSFVIILSIIGPFLRCSSYATDPDS